MSSHGVRAFPKKDKSARDRIGTCINLSSSVRHSFPVKDYIVLFDETLIFFRIDRLNNIFINFGRFAIWNRGKPVSFNQWIHVAGVKAR